MPHDADLFSDSSVLTRLTTFLGRLHGATTRIDTLKRYSVGFSWITFGFIAHWSGAQGPQQRKMVLRIGPPAGLFAPYRAAPECAVLNAVRGHGVPVPRIYAYSDTADDFGAPFFICEHIAGVAPLPWVAAGAQAFTPELRTALAEQFVAALAALHRFDWHATPVAALADDVTVATAAIVQVTHWERLLRRWQLRQYPVVEQALVWLRGHCPPAPRVTIVHGDYRIGNFLVDQDKISAMLDWELVHLGDPHEDLAYMSLRAFGGRGADGRFLVCHLLPGDELLARYAALSGIPVRAESMLFYELFNVFKLLVIHVGAVRCFEDGIFADLRMPAMGAQIPRLALQLEKALRAVA